MAVVLPDSVFDTNENMYIRLFLYRYFQLKAVVSLPLVTFQPYTPTKTSLLFAVKKADAAVEEWDTAWREAVATYQQFRKATVVQYVIQNHHIRSALIRIANQTNVDWYPTSNLLGADAMQDSVRTAIRERLKQPGSSSEELSDSVVPADDDPTGLAPEPGVEEATANGDDIAIAGGAPTGGRKGRQKGRKGKNGGERFDEFVELLSRLDAHVAAAPAACMTDAEACEARAALSGILRDRAPGDLDTLTIGDALTASYDDLVVATDLNYADKPGARAYANAWWCFAEVAARPEFAADVLYAEADNVGYKRSKKHPGGALLPGNHLFRVEQGEIVLEQDNPQSILEAMRARKLYGA